MPRCTEVRFASLLSSGFITAIVVNLPERKMAKRTSVRWLSGLKRHYLADLQRLWEWFKPYCCWNSLFIIIQGISYWRNKTNTLCGIKSAKLKGKVIKFEIMRLIVVYLALVKPVTKIVFSLINWWCQDFIGILENPIQWLPMKYVWPVQGTAIPTSIAERTQLVFLCLYIQILFFY